MIRALILRWARNRKPDFVIGGQEHPYLRRHWLLPRNRFFNVYVHQFLRSDDDRALHTHPWLFNASWLIEGGYIEWVPAGTSVLHPVPKFRYAGQWKFRWGDAAHRVQLWREGGGELPCWTVFITGPRIREWGFHCPQGFIPWQRFTAADDPGAVGKGCDA
jgi:hypothetical protein